MKDVWQTIDQDKRQQLGRGICSISMNTAQKVNYYGSRGLTTPKSGILGGMEMSNLDLWTPNSNIEAWRYLTYHPEKISKAWTKVSFTAWPSMVTIIASRGSKSRNFGVRSDSSGGKVECQGWNSLCWVFKFLKEAI